MCPIAESDTASWTETSLKDLLTDALSSLQITSVLVEGMLKVHATGRCRLVAVVAGLAALGSGDGNDALLWGRILVSLGMLAKGAM